MSIVALIPARGGSKGLPGKNLASVGGRSLVRIAVETALSVGAFDEVVVSSDDPAILAEGGAAGAVPLERPNDLAMDDTPTVAVVRHVLRARPQVDVLTILQPTAPFRDVEDVRRSLEALDEPSPAPSVATVTEVGHPPSWTFRLDPDGVLNPLLGWEQLVTRRQDSKPSYRLNGAVYVVRAEVVAAGGQLVGPGTRAVVMPEGRSLDIDSPLDLAAARALAGEAAT